MSATTCTSTFVLPDGPGDVIHCDGVAEHPGVMHGAIYGGKGYAWGDGAARDHHPGENLVIRMSQLRDVIRILCAANADAAVRLLALMKLHRSQGGYCLTCGPDCYESGEHTCEHDGTPWPCESASAMGMEHLPDDWYEQQIAAESNTEAGA